MFPPSLLFNFFFINYFFKKPAIVGAFVGILLAETGFTSIFWEASTFALELASTSLALPSARAFSWALRFSVIFSQKSVSHIIKPGTNTIVDKKPNVELHVLARFNKPLLPSNDLYNFLINSSLFSLATFKASRISPEVASAKDFPFTFLTISLTVTWQDTMVSIVRIQVIESSLEYISSVFSLRIKCKTSNFSKSIWEQSSKSFCTK